jgi:transglutaminase-like putative cysteine protease
MSSSEDVDWSRVTRATYRVEQTLRYEYASPIADLRHRLMIVPRREHGDQRRRSHELTATPAATVALDVDPFGNEVADVALDRVESHITFHLVSTLERHAGRPHRLGERAIGAPLYWAERRLLRPDEAIRDAAADLERQFPDPLERAEAIVRFVYRHFTYTKGLTDIFTTAAVAFRMAHGVCQDYAHVAIALARACHLTARYVSGHLIGEGATHAWIEFLLPHADGAVLVASFDPTRGARTSLRYVTIAVGRDYDDVAPTSGVFVGPCTGKLRSEQRVVLLETFAA